MKVRAIKAGDLDDLTAMAAEFKTFLGRIEGKRPRIDRAKLRAELKAGGFGKRRFFHGLIAKDASGPQGYALYHFGFNSNFNCGTLFISDLFVRGNARGKGIGHALMKKAAAIARDKGCGRMEWTVWNINAPAIGFYVGLGAKATDDEIIMGAALGKALYVKLGLA
ncbi:GNAT family N-acetyltransferase [Aestuariivirga sp.]|uniref:GNAT family N-acetyltransferase n=1 Tax=Aestuariivirga sp. TaxID=2650926 RepID=UPI0039E6C01D